MRALRATLLALTAMVALAACGGYESESGLPADTQKALIDQGRIREGENVLFYTSRGEDIAEAGAFFTETRVAAYWLVDGDDEDISIDLKDITALQLKNNDDSWTHADYVTVTWGPDNQKTKVFLQSDGEDFPEHFYEALKKQWEKTRAPA
ncbi:hypothetical protein [Actinoplanes subglobosus]|uniref:Lipoprotein n=1 Tax=Actinoplanes subglobosus TaxID=1547892 RepID=A0ABV8J003_9ACTN